MHLADRRLVAPVTVAVGATSAVYASGGSLPVSLPALAVMIGAGALLWARDRRQSQLLAAVGVSLVPTLTGLAWLTPALGLVAFAVLLRRRHESVLLMARPPARLWLVGAVTITAVGTFALWWHQAVITVPAGSFSWSRPQLPSGNVAVVVAMLVIAAGVNAVFEELLWRVFFIDMPGRAIGSSVWWPLLVSAGFGLSHLQGTPGGWIGVMATFCFGVAMVFLRTSGGGTIVVCVATHFVADLILLWGLYG